MLNIDFSDQMISSLSEKNKSSDISSTLLGFKQDISDLEGKLGLVVVENERLQNIIEKKNDQINEIEVLFINNK